MLADLTANIRAADVTVHLRQCFYCPVVRHLWWWLGGRPASAAVMRGMLSKGDSALVCPGGVRECLYMEKGREAVFLSGRTGFVRIAMQYGAAAHITPP